MAHNMLGGYTTLAVWGVPNALEQGTKSEVAHKWAGWLRNPCHLGGQRFTAGDKMRNGPQVGRLATCIYFLSSVKLLVFFFAVRSCNSFFAGNACSKNCQIVQFFVKPCNFLLQ